MNAKLLLPDHSPAVCQHQFAAPGHPDRRPDTTFSGLTRSVFVAQLRRLNISRLNTFLRLLGNLVERSEVYPHHQK
jgi:hypothetical protein